MTLCLDFSEQKYGNELDSIWFYLMKHKKIYSTFFYNLTDIKNIELKSIKDEKLRNLAIEKGYHETRIEREGIELEILNWLTEMQYVEKSDIKMHVVSISSEYSLLAPSLFPSGQFLLNGSTHSGWSEHTFDDSEFKVFFETYTALKKDVDAKLWPHVKYINAQELYSYDTTKYEVKDAFFDSIFLTWDNNLNKLVVDLIEPFFTSDSTGRDRKNWRRIKELPTEDFIKGSENILKEVENLEWKKNIIGIISFEEKCYFLERSSKTGELDSESIDILRGVNLSDLPKAAEEFEKGTAKDYVNVLGKELVKLWADCNYSAKKVSSISDDVFKPTNKVVVFVPQLISQVCTTEEEIMKFAEGIDQWIHEASGQGKRIPPCQIKEDVISIIYELRKHATHDREHGKQKEIREKFHKVGLIYKRFAKTVAPSSPNEWFLIQAGIMLSVKSLLDQTLAWISAKGMHENE